MFSGRKTGDVTHVVSDTCSEHCSELNCMFCFLNLLSNTVQHVLNRSWTELQCFRVEKSTCDVLWRLNETCSDSDFECRLL